MCIKIFFEKWRTRQFVLPEHTAHIKSLINVKIMINSILLLDILPLKYSDMIIHSINEIPRSNLSESVKEIYIYFFQKNRSISHPFLIYLRLLGLELFYIYKWQSYKIFAL